MEAKIEIRYNNSDCRLYRWEVKRNDVFEGWRWHWYT